MLRLIPLLLLALSAAPACANDRPPALGVSVASTRAAASSKQIEKELQRLSWSQFRTVVEAVPKLKSDVDAYGPMGWDFVRANYRAYPWKKSVDKLDEQQKNELFELIRKAKSGAPSAP